MLKRLKALLADPRSAWLLIALALALTAVSMGNGVNLDDHVLQLNAAGHPSWDRPAWDLFAVGPDDAAHLRALKDQGALPWWTTERTSLRPFQPLASLTHALDFALWPGSPWLMHAHNLVWYALALIVVARLYREVIPTPWIAGLALTLYALDDAHGLAVGWIASRSLVMATFFGALALLAHHRWIVARWSPGAWLGPLALAAALLSSDVAVAVLAYAVACAVVLDSGAAKARAARVAPIALVVGVWKALVLGLGYGIRGSGAATEPLLDPLGFLMAVPDRASALIFGQWGVLPSDLWILVPPTFAGAAGLVAGAALCVFLIGYVVRPMVARDAAARFWILGAVMALVPACAIYPTDRILFFTGIGGFAFVAMFLGSMADEVAWVGEQSPRWRRRSKGLIVTWTLVHGIVAPAVLPIRSVLPAWLSESFERLSEALPQGAELAGEQVIVVRCLDSWSASALPLVRMSRGGVVPEATRVLYAGLGGVQYERSDERTLIATAPDGLLAGRLENLFWTDAQPMVVGQRWEVQGMTAQIEAVTEDGRPTRLRYRFDRALDDGSLRWVSWEAGVFVEVAPPRVGAALEIAPVLYDPDESWRLLEAPEEP